MNGRPATVVPPRGTAWRGGAVTSNCQLARPSASRSRTIVGSTRITESTAMRPSNRGARATRTSTATRLTMSGVSDPGRLARRTPAAVRVGVGRMRSDRPPSMRTGRPVAAASSAVTRPLWAFQSTKLGTTNRAPTATTGNTTMAISTLRKEAVSRFRGRRARDSPTGPRRRGGRVPAARARPHVVGDSSSRVLGAEPQSHRRYNVAHRYRM